MNDKDTRKIRRRVAVIGLALVMSTVAVYALIAFTTKLLSSDIAEGDWFGDAVAVDGTTAVIAAYKDDTSTTITDTGSAYIFTYDGTVWNEQAKLTPSDGAEQDQFGFSADIDADTVVIGALQNDANGTNSGAAYVYVQNNGVWSEEQKLVASDGAGGDYFGYSAAISADTIVIGAFYEDNANGANAGAAYIFTRSGTTWTQQQKIIASDGAAADEFGNSVDIDGDTVVIGARYNASNGAAYVYTRSGSVWSLEQKLTASDGAAGDTFGLSTALEGDRVVISAPQDDDGYTDTGSLYVFERSSGAWTEQAKLTASDGELGDRLGLFTMGISGDYIAAAAPWSNDDGSNSGATYLFELISGSWIEQEKIVGDDVTADDWYGIASDIDGDWILMGAERSNSVYYDAGSVYAYSISANNGPTPTPTSTPTNSPPSKPTLILPSGNTTTVLPTYKWSEIANADYYQVLIYNVDTGVTDYNMYRYDTDYTCDGTTCSETINLTLTTGTSYKWYMQAWNTNGASGWTAGKDYSIIGPPPGLVTQIAPLTTTMDTSPSFEWRPEPTATGYVIAVYDETNNTILFYNDASPYTTSICTGNDPATDVCTVQPNITLTVGDSYTWLVRALNSYGSGPWSIHP